MPSVARIHSRRTYRGNNATSTSWTHVVPSMGNGMLLCEVFARNNGTVTPPTYGGTPLTLVPGSEVSAGTSTSRRYVAWFYMLNPPAGSATLALTVGSADSGNYGIVAFNDYNVNQSTPFRSQGGGNFALVDSGTAVTSTSLSPASSVGDLVLSALYSASAPTGGSGQYKEASAGLSNRCQTMSKEAEASSTTLSATSASNTVVHSAISIIGDATTQPAPADYTGSRGKKSWIVSGNAAGEVYSSGATQYFALSPTVEASTSSPNHTIMRNAGTFDVPSCRVTANTATGDGTLTLWVNNASTGVTVTVPAGATGLFAGSGTASISAGDGVGWKFTGGTGGSTTLTQAMVAFEATAAETVSFLGTLSSSAGKLVPGETRYVNVHGSRASTAGNTDERKAALPMQVDGTWSGLRTEKVGTTTNGTVTAGSRINGAAGNQVLTWPTGGSEGSQEDTTHSDTVVPGDEAVIEFVSSGTVGDFEYERVSGRLVTTNGEFVVQAGASGGTGVAMGAAGTQFFALGGELGFAASEAASQIAAPFDMAIKRLWVRLGENVSLATGDSTAVLRINGTDTAMAVLFQAGGEHYWVADFENVVNANAGDLISISGTHGTGGTSNTLRVRGWGFVGIERVAGGTTHNESVSESTSASDAVSALAGFACSASGSASAGDVPTAALVVVAAVSESASAADAADWGAATYDVTVTEAAGAGDAISAICTMVAAASESISASDAFTVTAVVGAEVSEGASATDATDWGGASYSVSVAEAATLSDAVSAALQAIASVSESGGAADTTVAIISAGVAVVESAAASALAAAGLQTAALLTETAVASDAVALNADNVIDAGIDESASAQDHIVAVLIDGFMVLTVKPRRPLTGGASRPPNLSGRGR